MLLKPRGCVWCLPSTRFQVCSWWGVQVQLLTVSRSGALGLCLSEEHHCHPDRLFWGEGLALLLAGYPGGDRLKVAQELSQLPGEEQLGVPRFLSLGQSVCATPSERVWMGSMAGWMGQDSAWWPASKGGDKISNSGRFMPEFWPRPFTSRRSDLLYVLVLFQKPGYWAKGTCYLFFLF